ncbi:hypothetical protein GW17_00029618 [Ensete ventricosum]|nr:hypothetical protein GW17_00029618 [Ensete ventricosum]
MVGNLLEVHRELAEGIGSLPGWRKGVRWKKTETRRKIVRGSRKACLDDTVGAHQKIARTSSKVSGRSLGTHREIIGGRL